MAAKPRVMYAVRDQLMLEATTLDGLVPPGHVVREVWAYAESMDLAPLYDAIAAREGSAGAPCFDPRTLVALWLYATIDGVGSARALAKLVEEHAVYRWIAGGVAINHHTLSSFRTAHAALLERLLVASVATLAREGLIDAASMSVAHDGMRVLAAAGAGTFRKRERLQQLVERARERVEKLKTQEHDEQAAPQSARSRAAQERAARERVERLDAALAAVDELEAAKRRRADHAPRASTTDPAARIMRMPHGGTRPAYNIQFTTETTTRAIVGVRLAPSGTDVGTLEPAMRQHAAAHGRLPARVLADGGFAKNADIAALERDSCEVYMPDAWPNARRPEGCSKDDLPLIARWRQRMATQAARELYKLRSSTVEWANACARQQGLRQLNVRGRTKVLAVALWHALAHNTWRTIALLRRIPAPQPA